jgi:hypothetical protein
MTLGRTVTDAPTELPLVDRGQPSAHDVGGARPVPVSLPIELGCRLARSAPYPYTRVLTVVSEDPAKPATS